MILTILLALLVLGIAFYQVTQGLFSALIMTILTVLSAAIAFNYYELLARELYAYQPSHADAIALLALFILPLLALRWVYDFFLGGNVVFGVWADRIGGGALGIVSGIILVGVLAVAIQMLPMGRSILGYEPFDPALQRQTGLAPFYPDQFVLGMVEKLSTASLANDRPYQKVHDDLLRELYCARNDAGYQSQITSDASDIPGWMSVEAAYRPGEAELKALGDVPPNPLMGKQAASRVVVVRVQVDEKTREVPAEDKEGSDWWYLPATHFRLVTTEGNSYYPVAYLTWDHKNGQYKLNPAKIEDGQVQIANLLVGRKWYVKGGPPKLTVDWVYVLPDDPSEGKKPDELPPGMTFERPRYMVFRRVCKQTMPATIRPGLPPVFGPGGATTTPTQPVPKFLPLLSEPLPRR